MDEIATKLDARLTTLETLRSEDHRDIKEINASLVRIELRLVQMVQCPKPGLCLELERIVEGREPRLRKLEDAVLQGKTAAKVGSAVVGFFAAILGSGVTVLLNHLLKGP